MGEGGKGEGGSGGCSDDFGGEEEEEDAFDLLTNRATSTGPLQKKGERNFPPAVVACKNFRC